jgi:flavin reductase (DIM6/NTAB) family NADH-FMN oxidoreductase RutF
MNRFLGLTGIFALLFLVGTCLSFVSFAGLVSSDKSERTIFKVIESSEQANSEEGKEDEKTSLGARTVIIPTPVWVIGSYDHEGKPNMMTSSWVGVCSSKPASVMTCLREATYTFGNIMERKAFTVNIPSEYLGHEAAYVGRISGRDVDKFMRTGLTPVKSALVDAPYIKEFPLVIECQLKQTIELGSHTMFIGEIMDVKADRSVLSEGGVPDIAKLKPFVFTPGSSKFYGIGRYLGNVSELAKEAEKRWQ